MGGAEGAMVSVIPLVFIVGAQKGCSQWWVE
jgi:hypothetical protein